MNGILYIAFGEQYERLAAHTICYSRKFTDIPIVVLTNIKSRCEKWNGIKNIQFIDFDLPQDKNRQVKTSMIEHSPFAKTLYLDCDAIIQKKGIEKVFDLINDDRLLLNIYGRWSRVAPSLYRKAFANAKLSLPINIYYGAICGFTKNEKTKQFFALWNRYWIENGSGREMPSLACAVANSKIAVKEIGNKDAIFSWKINNNAIVQHEYGRYVCKIVGCADFHSFKPFDKNRIVA